LIPVSPDPVSRCETKGSLSKHIIMSSNYSSNGNGRSRNSGGRRRPSGGSHSSSNRSGGAPHRDERPRRETIAPQEPKKQGFFARILSLIGLGGSKKNPSVKSSRPQRADRPQVASSRPSRKPEHIEVTTPRLYVGNLSFDATESDLQELFSGIGSVQNVEIVSNRDTHRSKGFGFVQLTTLEEAKRAVTELHDKEYMGRKLVVSGAKAVAESRSERSERREASSEGVAPETNEAAAA
jgi:RNA recognition motif-containing protein